MRRSSLPAIPCLLMALACAQSSPTAPPAEFPAISKAPIAQSVFPGMSATFSVEAQGEALGYQWFRNGVAIPGATGAIWTTGPLKGPEDNAEISVVVDNRGTRFPEPFKAALTVRPALDLRFKGLGVEIPVSGFDWSNVVTGMEIYSDQAFSGPLCIGGATQTFSSWFYTIWSLPPGYSGLGMRNGALYLPYFETDLQELFNRYGDGAVFTCLDIGETAGVWAFTLVSSQQPGRFTPFSRGSVALDQLQAYATQEGAQGRVITALSFWSGAHPYVMSYGWSLAPTARFEAQVARATPDTLVATAQGLSDQGYVLTAVGVDNVNGQGFVLVGTRAEGATRAREFQAQERPAIGGGWINVAQTYDAANHKAVFLVQR